MYQGNANRAVGGHDLNERSSRSHSIITVTCRGENTVDGSTSFGRCAGLCICGEGTGKNWQWHDNFARICPVIRPIMLQWIKRGGTWLRHCVDSPPPFYVVSVFLKKRVLRMTGLSWSMFVSRLISQGSSTS